MEPLVINFGDGENFVINFGDGEMCCMDGWAETKKELSVIESFRQLHPDQPLYLNLISCHY